MCPCHPILPPYPLVQSDRQAGGSGAEPRAGRGGKGVRFFPLWRPPAESGRPGRVGGVPVPGVGGCRGRSGVLLTGHAGAVGGSGGDLRDSRAAGIGVDLGLRVHGPRVRAALETAAGERLKMGGGEALCSGSELVGRSLAWFIS